MYAWLLAQLFEADAIALAAGLTEDGSLAFVRVRWLNGPQDLPSCWRPALAEEVALRCPEILPGGDTGMVEILRGYDPSGAGRWTTLIRRLRRDAVRLTARAE